MNFIINDLSGTQAFATEGVYVVPGKYTASAAVRDNDGAWNVKTNNIEVL